jgi:hypothetical protein
VEPRGFEPLTSWMQTKQMPLRCPCQGKFALLSALYRPRLTRSERCSPKIAAPALLPESDMVQRRSVDPVGPTGTCTPWPASRPMAPHGQPLAAGLPSSIENLLQGGRVGELRDRALQAASKATAELTERQRAEAARERATLQEKKTLAEELCFKELGARVTFNAEIWEDGYTDSRRADVWANIEGVKVQLVGSALSHDIASLGAAIQALEEKSREEARLEARRKARTCPWCGQVAADWGWERRSGPETPANSALSLKFHQRDCKKAPLGLRAVRGIRDRFSQ